MTSSNPEYAELAKLCRERAEGYGALRQSSLTAIALDRSATALERLSSDREMMREALDNISRRYSNGASAETLVQIARMTLSRINTALGDKE